MGETDGRNYKKRERKKLREKGEVGGGVEGPPPPWSRPGFMGERDLEKTEKGEVGGRGGTPLPLGVDPVSWGSQRRLYKSPPPPRDLGVDLALLRLVGIG